MRVDRSQIARASAVAALVLAVSSRGELALLALLLVAPHLAVMAGLAVVAAVVASSWRWGTTSLEALAGAQAVLGPAGGVGPVGAAIGSWLAAAALLAVLARGRDPVRTVAVGATVAAVLAGPAPGGDVPVRVAVAIGASAAGYALARGCAGSGRTRRLADLVGMVAGGGAVVAVASTGPPWPPLVEGALVLEGAAIASAAMAIAFVVAALGSALQWRGPGVWPTVEIRFSASAAPPSQPPR